MNDLLDGMEKQEVTALIAIDLNAAFDTIDHGILIDVLHRQYGVCGTALNWVHSYLRPHSCRVSVNQTLSSLRLLQCSVPQGSCLGPWLYLTYAGTLFDAIPPSISLYGLADNHIANKRFCPSSTTNELHTIKELEQCAVTINNWMNENKLSAFFTFDALRNYNLWSCQKVCEALTFLLDNIYIRFGYKLYRQIVADLFLFCYERDLMLSLSEDKQSGVIEAFNSTSRYLDDLLNIDNTFFDSMVNRIYPSELQSNKSNVSDAEASFLDLHLSISDGFVKTKIYDKRDDFDFDIVNFPFLDGDVPLSASYGVYISQLIRFARVSSHVDDFNTRNKVLTAKLLRQGYRYHKLRKAFSKLYRRHFDILSKYNVRLKTLLLQGLSEPEFYGDLVYKFRKNNW